MEQKKWNGISGRYFWIKVRLTSQKQVLIKQKNPPIAKRYKGLTWLNTLGLAKFALDWFMQNLTNTFIVDSCHFIKTSDAQTTFFANHITNFFDVLVRFWHPGRGSSFGVSRPSLCRLNHSKTRVRDKHSVPYTSFNISISFCGIFPQFHKKVLILSDHLAFFRRYHRDYSERLLQTNWATGRLVWQAESGGSITRHNHV